jgi:beta-glucanase (GH16 family)
MKRTRVSLLLLLFIFLLAACKAQAQPEAIATPEWELAGWTLVWQDEFDGTEIDRTKWTFDIGGHGWGNNEVQAYTDRSENARIEDGMLVIEAREEEFVRRNYTSARLKTQDLHSWTYGRFEARMRLPYGQGIWPAFWMLGANIQQQAWPASGEIDIMEYIGRDANRVYATVHGPGYSGGGGVGHYINMEPGVLNEEFHVFAIEWEPGEIRWYVDDENFFTITPASVPGEWVYDHPFFLLINLAVGGNWPGYPDDSTVFPQFLLVDYVRVYQRSEQMEAASSSGPVHIAEMNMEVDDSDGDWRAAVVITVQDVEGNPVEDITVAGGWVGVTNRGDTSAITNEQGVARLLSFPVTREGELTFCVTDLRGANTSYDKSANNQACAKIEK